VYEYYETNEDYEEGGNECHQGDYWDVHIIGVL